ncbi:MAG TPA: GDP-mannose 4,6-dehydratase [Thermoanaerobaculia bacterium]|nr:GDP-mannose 4,6-dehydratase [Thermoanaerobaculia bacterium]
MFWRDRRVLVTGGCGFIGSHLVEALLGHGAQVSVLGKYNSRSDAGFLHGNDHPGLTVRLGDIADPWFVQSMARGVDTIFHLAALIGIPYSYAAPSQYVETNIKGTLAVLEAARREGVRRVVHTSTSETYGTAQYAPIDESHPLVGQSPYSATKIAADKLAESYFLSFDLPVVTLRPFNTFGPRQSLRAVIPSLMAQALYADEITVGALDPVRDMNYVGDTVAGFLGAAAADGVEGNVYNVGSGVGHTIGEILEQVQKVAGTGKPVRQEEERVRPAKSEVGRLVCDYSRAAAAFGYAPSVTLAEGLG